MKRIQVQPGEGIDVVARRKSVVSSALAKSFGSTKRKRQLTLASFPFVGAASTRQGKLSPVSERYDEALAEAPL